MKDKCSRCGIVRWRVELTRGVPEPIRLCAGCAAEGVFLRDHRTNQAEWERFVSGVTSNQARAAASA